MPFTPYVKDVCNIARQAGDIILGHYNGKIEVEEKSDHTPVTIADKEANDFIVRELIRIAPDIPVVAEENSEEDNKKAFDKALFWLVDPLDGTKSFIKKTGQFTVNIALIEGHKPVGGAVYVPANDVMYFTGEDGAAYRQIAGRVPENIAVRSAPASGLVVVASKSHRTKETDRYIEQLDNVSEFVSAASSLKFCLVAEGKADVYPRFGPTCEWDTAAGHAVLLAAGGSMEQVDGSEFRYGKGDLLNPFFVAKGNI